MEQDVFALAREQKRKAFAQDWDLFLQSKRLLLALWLLTGAQAAFSLLAGVFLYDTAIAIGLLGENHAVWCCFAVAGVQLLFCAPGWVALTGLWHLRKHARWGQSQTPDIQGVKYIRLANLSVCVAGGAAVAVYPTAIITAGDYVSQSQLTHIFYLFLSATLLFLVGITLVRIVLRCAEENITCGWANTRMLLLLSLIYFAAGAAIWILPFHPFYPAAAALCFAFGILLLLYRHTLCRIRTQQEQIDAQAISSRRQPYDDPYRRY